MFFENSDSQRDADRDSHIEAFEYLGGSCEDKQKSPAEVQEDANMFINREPTMSQSTSAASSSATLFSRRASIFESNASATGSSDRRIELCSRSKS